MLLDGHHIRKKGEANMKHRKRCMLVIASALFLVFFILTVVRAESKIHEISNFEELIQAAELSRKNGYQSDTYVLQNNIEITKDDLEILNTMDVKYVSFGSSELPFTGEFDGNGYYISNLTYSSTTAPIYDTGLFSHTGTGATIRNLTIINASIDADYRGGIVAGYSKGTLFENILVKDSHLFVTAANNVVSLITDGGIRGGAIVGEAEDCILYNCESLNTIVNTNSTAGVAALSGKGLYLGGLVGTSVSTEIEYSRVVGGTVKNYYDVAVGALGGNTLYVGGIVGQMKSASKVIDSFSTAELYYYCATYVSVGSGNTGHIGGIAGAVYGDQNEIIRSHFAGQATSRQYNAVLVIPIIQNNVNISGIADVFEGGSVVNTYFKSSLSPDTDMKVLGNTSTTTSYGPLSDDKYIDVDYWQTQNYDFYGNIKRNTSYSDNHTNKWIIDLDKKIPVHGNSVSVALDFSGAGTVTIGKTDLVNVEVSTQDAYCFAVQGLKPSEYGVNLYATANEGYRFKAWYKVQDITASTLENSYEFYNDILKEYSPIDTNLNINNIYIENNDLFIAYYQARVVFHDIYGNIIDVTSGENVNKISEQDWYNYGTKIPNVLPELKPSSTTAKLIGWTTIKSDEAGGGYSSITMPQLTSLKNSNEFYRDNAIVEKAMDLYPVYIDLISNINTVFEGNEQDSIDDVSQRDGVGYTTVKLDENGTVNISAIGYGENGGFTDGYRFLGWYNEEGTCISSSTNFKLNDDVDLTETHTFTAKLEYRVDYYGTTTKFYGSSDFDGNPFKQPFVSVWYKYNETFKDMSGSLVVDQGDSFESWHVGVPNIPHASDEYDSCTIVSSSESITKHFAVHAHVSGSSNYEIYITSDFPGSGNLSHTGLPSGINFKVSMTEIVSGYNFLFWACSRENGNRQETTTDPENFDSGSVFYTGADYGYEAHLDANVTFYNKQSVATTVTRRYKEPIFSANSIKYQYTWPVEGSNININAQNVVGGVHTSVAFAYDLSAENMQVEGYKFVGWIDKNSVTADEWDYIYGTSGRTYSVGNDPYVSGSIDIVTPYLMSSEAICTEPMEIYPVYVKYNVITTVNVYYNNQASNINIPSNPTYSLKYGTEYATVTLVPNTDTYVIGASGEKYILSSIVRVYEDGSEEEISLNSEGAYKYNIIAGPTYTFMAKYEPVILWYHLNDVDTKIVLKNRGENIGIAPLPTYTVSDLVTNYIFEGWTTLEPINVGYHKFNSYEELKSNNIDIIESSNMVNDAMEFWPVYIRTQININSNIDDYLNDNGISLNSIRYISRPNITQTQINISNENVDSYEFVGWYKNYSNNDNMGELVAKDYSFVLEKDESLESVSYTAVYREMYQINYYNTTGEIIYTANAYENEGRTFIKYVEDEEGNLVTVPIDTEAYEYVKNSLNNNEHFQNWQWVNSNGTIVKWEDFCNQAINSDMNLFPIIRKINVFDSHGNELDYEGSQNEEPSVVLAMYKNKAYVCLNSLYEQPYLKIHIEDNSYKSENEYDIQYAESVIVNVYKNKDITLSSLGTSSTSNIGDANINLYGNITINRISNSEIDMNDVFIYDILDGNGQIIKQTIVPQGSRKIIQLPYGTYTLVQKQNWAWRYNSVNETIHVNNVTNNAIIIDNQRNINKWFDNTTYMDNEFK